MEQRKFQATSANNLRDDICFYTSNKEHAFYLGQEITKAEIAYQNGFPYVQDKALMLKK